jgi:hypothetical protein
VLGVFNAQFSLLNSEHPPIRGYIFPDDIPSLVAEKYAVYTHNSAELRCLTARDRWEIALPELTWELFTIVPIQEGIAPIGLVDMYNSSGAIVHKEWITRRLYQIEARGSGRFLVYSKRSPGELTVDGVAQEFKYHPKNGWLEFEVGGTASKTIHIHL